MNESSLLLSVIICTYNRASLLPYCIDSIINQSIDRNLYEIVIIDNNSTDNTQHIISGYIKDHTFIRSFIEFNQGISYARNRGWKEAKGKYVAYIDDDTRACFDWCNKILNAFEYIKPQPVAVGGKILHLFETPPPKWFPDGNELATCGDEAGFLKEPRLKYGFSGANMSIKRDMLEQYGGFAINYDIVGHRVWLGEEPGFFYKIYKKYPWFWYDPDIQVFHWTSVQKMRFINRMKGAYWHGLIQAYIYKWHLCSLNYVSNHLLSSSKIPLKKSNIFECNILSKFVRLSEKIIRRLGYLIGMMDIFLALCTKRNNK